MARAAKSASGSSGSARTAALPRSPISRHCRRCRIRDRRRVHDPPGIGRGGGAAFRDPAGVFRPGKLARIPMSIWSRSASKCPIITAPVMAAIEAGKHVYCEWPLGRDTGEAMRMLDAAERKGVRHAVGLQGQMSPAINYVKDLVAEGYVGRVLTATMIGCAPNWGATIDRAYQADRANGANLMTITGGHQIDALCHCLGEFRELSAFVVSQRDHIPLPSTGEIVAKTSPDQLVVSGIVGDGAVVSFQIRGGMARGTEFLFEIHGETAICAHRHLAGLDAAPGTA